jgi:hypothetical protein
VVGHGVQRLEPAHHVPYPDAVTACAPRDWGRKDDRQQSRRGKGQTGVASATRQ